MSHSVLDLKLINSQNKNCLIVYKCKKKTFKNLLPFLRETFTLHTQGEHYSEWFSSILLGQNRFSFKTFVLKVVFFCWKFKNTKTSHIHHLLNWVYLSRVLLAGSNDGTGTRWSLLLFFLCTFSIVEKVKNYEFISVDKTLFVLLILVDGLVCKTHTSLEGTLSKQVSNPFVEEMRCHLQITINIIHLNV